MVSELYFGQKEIMKKEKKKGMKEERKEVKRERSHYQSLSKRDKGWRCFTRAPNRN